MATRRTGKLGSGSTGLCGSTPGTMPLPIEGTLALRISVVGSNLLHVDWPEEKVTRGVYPVAWNEQGGFPVGASKVWSGRWDLNPRQLAWEARTLPLSYARPLRMSNRILRRNRC